MKYQKAMPTGRQGFIAPLILALIAMLLVSAGAYVYTHKMCAVALLYCPSGTHNVFNSITCSQKCVAGEQSTAQTINPQATFMHGVFQIVPAQLQ